MATFYALVFLVLMSEMLTFMALIVPLPFQWRRKMFLFISGSPIVAKLQYGMKITFIFILILFIDSVNRVYRVQIELAMATENGTSGGRSAVLGSERMEVQARKFYSQRNMYLCGFTLFLSLILNRTYVMILDQLRLEEKLGKYEGNSAAGGKDAGKLNEVGQPGEIGTLKNIIAEKNRDIDTLKKQCEGLQKEYNDMGDKVSGAQKVMQKYGKSQ